MFIGLLPNKLRAPEERHVPVAHPTHFAPNGAKERRRDEPINILLLRSKEPIVNGSQSEHTGDVNVEPLFGPRSVTACEQLQGLKVKPGDLPSRQEQESGAANS